MMQHLKSRNISTSSVVGGAVIFNQPFEDLKSDTVFIFIASLCPKERCCVMVLRHLPLLLPAKTTLNT
jgi:hypothetical protein